MTRDFAGEMFEFVDKYRVGLTESVTATGLAHVVADELRAKDPTLLRGWLDDQAEDVLREMINRMTRSQRTRNRMISARRVFGDAAAAYEAGDPGPLTTWLSTEFVINPDRDRKPLGAMVKDDVLFVVDDYLARERSMGLRRAFFEGIAKKVGRRTVGEVFTEDKLAELWGSIEKMYG